MVRLRYQRWWWLSLGLLILSAQVYGQTDRVALGVYAAGFIGEVFLVDASGESSLNLTQHPADDSYPVWSPDGTRILFQSDRTGDHELYVVNADGTGLTQLTNRPSYDGYADWSPRGDQIVFVSDHDFGMWDIWVMNVDGSNTINLTPGPGFENSPCWSPDGTKIAYTLLQNQRIDIYIMDTDGSNSVQLTQTGVDEQPVWSPEGSHIAFTSARDGAWSIHIMNSDGKDVRNLTRNPASERHPAWSPDGKHILFTRARPDHTLELWIMGADGIAQEPLFQSVNGVYPSRASWFDPLTSSFGVTVSGRWAATWGGMRW